MARNSLNMLLFVGLLGTALVCLVVASDPDLTTDLGISSTSAADFTFTGFRNPATPGPGVAVPSLATFATGLPGLKGLALTSVYFSFGPKSQIDPHIHPRASEVFYVTQGSVQVGFVTTTNTLFQTVVQAGDLFVFPKGTLHYQRNNEATPAAGYSVLNSENPGLLFVANALFAASSGGIPDIVLSTAFRTDTKTIDTIEAAFT